MQTEAPDVFDVSKESKATLDMYGPGSTALGCLMAARLVEKGVRMVQTYYGKGDPWDAHNDIMTYRKLAKDSDQALRGADQGPEAARPVRGHAGRRRHRVRPHAGDPDGERERAAASSTAATTIVTASRSGWPAAASRAA